MSNSSINRSYPPDRTNNRRDWVFVALVVVLLGVGGWLWWSHTPASRCLDPHSTATILSHRLQADSAAMESTGSPRAALDSAEALNASEAVIKAHPECFSGSERAAVEYWQNLKGEN